MGDRKGDQASITSKSSSPLQLSPPQYPAGQSRSIKSSTETNFTEICQAVPSKIFSDSRALISSTAGSTSYPNTSKSSPLSSQTQCSGVEFGRLSRFGEGTASSAGTDSLSFESGGPDLFSAMISYYEMVDKSKANAEGVNKALAK